MTAERRLRVRSRTAWRAWLARHHATEREIWLVFRKVHTPGPRLAYAEAVEEALCFGWIDTTVRRLDADSYLQRFTPRTRNTTWSAINLERFDRMVAEGRMTADGLAKRAPDAAPPPPRHAATDPVPEWIEAALAARPRAAACFRGLAPGYRRNYVRFIVEAKREATRQRRLAEALRRLESGEKEVFRAAASRASANKVTNQR